MEFTKEFAENYIEACYGPSIEQAHTLIVNGKKFVDAEELEEAREELMKLRSEQQMLRASDTSYLQFLDEPRRLKEELEKKKRLIDSVYTENSVLWAFVNSIMGRADKSYETLTNNFQELHTELESIWEEYGEDNG
jgi:hypothetical protein